ncbi:Arc family DNA binding domain-containing protein [Collinsella sp. zg1085]|uniref:Arc family DNA binding domain-containing protein n=1 Tax=Collinsella sp. zg1085 TaxID=2844380 RepID=UPI001C0B6BAB|nr:Arc family DNA binding domain-containing protein [Collinsella sp. zg1085]QWT17852.1 Arc family DNA binding domain-containing protein [Collinsella sp. zg1085]
MARKQYPLRIDPAIWEAIQSWADDEMRSANGQVEWIMRDALRRAGRLPSSHKPRATSAYEEREGKSN